MMTNVTASYLMELTESEPEQQYCCTALYYYVDYLNLSNRVRTMVPILNQSRCCCTTRQSDLK